MTFPTVLYDKLCDLIDLAKAHSDQFGSDKEAFAAKYLLMAARHLYSGSTKDMVAHYIRSALQSAEMDLGPAYNARFVQTKHYAVVSVDNFAHQATITRLLSHEPWQTTKDNATIYTFTAYFADGKQMDIKVVNAPKDGGGPWTEGVLFDSGGHEMTHTEPMESFDEFSVEIDNTTYTAVIRKRN